MTELQTRWKERQEAQRSYDVAQDAYGNTATQERLRTMLEARTRLKSAIEACPERFTLTEAVEIAAISLFETRKDDLGPARGRPSTFTAEVGFELCRLMALNRSLAAAADELDIPIATVWSWRTRNPRFRELVQKTRYLMHETAKRDDHYQKKRQRRRRRTAFLKRLQAPVLSGFYGGRPERYRPEFVERVQETRRRTAQELGVTERTVYNWQSRHSDFRSAQTIAEVERRSSTLFARALDLLSKAQKVPGLLPADE